MHKKLYFPALASSLCLFAVPVLAADDFGTYLVTGSMADFSPSSVVKDIGDLDFEDDATSEWAVLSPDGVAIPDPIRVEDKSVDNVTPADIASGNYSIAVTA